MAKLLVFIALISIANAAVLDTSCMDGDFLSEQPSEAERLQVSQGERDFSVNLIKSLFQDFNASGIHHNIFVSPSSIHATLMLAYFGSEGQTQVELESVMGTSGLSKQSVQRSYLFERAFQAVRERNPDLGYTLTNANKLYFHRALPLNSCIQLLLQNELGVVDFSKADKTRNEINQWVKEKTQKKITDFLPAGALSAGTKMALVNAAYFKGMSQLCLHFISELWGDSRITQPISYLSFRRLGIKIQG